MFQTLPIELRNVSNTYVRAYAIELFYVMSSPSRIPRKSEESRHVGIQGDSSWYSVLGKFCVLN